MTSIERSPGLPIGQLGRVAGGGHSGATAELDQLVQIAAEMLRDAYNMDVVIRFNSDRRSGGAWLKTHEPDGFWGNAEIGIGARLVTNEDAQRARERLDIDLDPGIFIYAHIGHDALRDPVIANSLGDRPYYHGPQDSIESALAFVREHGSLDHLEMEVTT